MATKLKNLTIEKVALVDAGANPDADVLIYKSAETPSNQEAIVADETSTETVAAETVAQADYDAVVAERDALAEQVAELTPAPSEDEVLKGLPEDVRKRLEDAEATIAKMEQERRAEMFAKKAGEFGHVAPAADLAPVLEAIDRVDADLAKSLDQVLKAANARIAEGGLFAEVGSDAERATDGEAETLIAAEVEKGASRAEAIRKVFSARPDLYPANRVGADAE